MAQQVLFALSVVALAVWLAQPRYTCGLLSASRAGQGERFDWVGPALLALVVVQLLLHALGWL